MKFYKDNVFYIFSAGLLCFALYNLYDYHPNLTHEFLNTAYHNYTTSDDQLEMGQYIKAFPVEKYSRYTTNGPIYFYLDPQPDVIKNWLRHGLTWEPEIQAVMQQYVKKGSNILDIGAHVGTHTIFLAKALNNTGMVWAFEPQKKIFTELAVNLLANHVDNVKPLRAAVGDHQGIIHMSPPVKGNEGGTPIGKNGETVRLVRIDDFGIENVSLMKVDVEGYEEQVLDGAKQTIAKSKPVIIIEISGGIAIESATTKQLKRIKHTIAKLKAMGYSVTRINPSDYLAEPV